MAHGIDGVYRLQDIFKWIHHRVLSGFEGETLMAHVLEGYDLAANLVLGELTAGDGLVFEMIGAVDASVHTVVGEIERSKHYDTVAIEPLLYATGKLGCGGYDFGLFRFEERERFAVGESLHFFALFYDGAEEREI